MLGRRWGCVITVLLAEPVRDAGVMQVSDHRYLLGVRQQFRTFIVKRSGGPVCSLAD